MEGGLPALGTPGPPGGRWVPGTSRRAGRQLRRAVRAARPRPRPPESRQPARCRRNRLLLPKELVLGAESLPSGAARSPVPASALPRSGSGCSASATPDSAVRRKALPGCLSESLALLPCASPTFATGFQAIKKRQQSKTTKQKAKNTRTPKTTPKTTSRKKPLAPKKNKNNQKTQLDSNIGSERQTNEGI